MMAKRQKRTCGWTAGIVFGLAVAPVGRALEIPDAGPVGADLALAAAEHYAAERWPGCRFLDMTPYLALSGSTNAFAVQFALPGSAIADVAELRTSARARRQRLEAALYGGERVDGGPPAATLPLNPVDSSGSLPERIGAGQQAFEEVTLVLEAPAGADGGAVRTGVRTLARERADARRAVYRAAHALALPEEVGTVIVAANMELFPLLERFNGTAPHIRYAGPARRALGGRLEQSRGPLAVYYLGPLSYFAAMEAYDGIENEAQEVLVDVRSGLTYDLDEQVRISRSGGVWRAPAGRNRLSTRDVWRRVVVEGGAGAGGEGRRVTGVPLCWQEAEGANASGPCAAAQVLAHWNDRGFPVLVGGGESAAGQLDELVISLMHAMRYHPVSGVFGRDVPGAIVSVCNDPRYGRELAFESERVERVHWERDVRAELDAGRPFLYHCRQFADSPFFSHFSVAVGYRCGLNHMLELQTADAPDTIHELNRDNVPGAVEELVKIRAGATPAFDCLFVDAFEGAPCAWTLAGDGPAPRWLLSDARSLKPAAPEGALWGNGAWSFHGWAGEDGAATGRAWMVRGPVSTAGRLNGELSVYLWSDVPAELTGDGFALLASLDGRRFGGRLFRGTGQWVRCALDLADVPGVGNVLNRPGVWLALWMERSGIWQGEGYYADRAALRVSRADACTFPVSFPGRWVSVAVWDQSKGVWHKQRERYAPSRIRISNLANGAWYWVGIWDYGAGEWGFRAWYMRQE